MDFIPFRSGDGPDGPGELRRRLVPEQERNLYFFGWLMTVCRWDKEAWRSLPVPPMFAVDFGDLVISLSVARWPDERMRDWPP